MKLAVLRGRFLFDSYKRRAHTGRTFRGVLTVKTAILFRGYIDWVYPWRIAEGELFYMLGDHGGYSPVKFNRW